MNTLNFSVTCYEKPRHNIAICCIVLTWKQNIKIKTQRNKGFSDLRARNMEKAPSTQRGTEGIFEMHKLLLTFLWFAAHTAPKGTCSEQPLRRLQAYQRWQTCKRQETKMNTHKHTQHSTQSEQEHCSRITGWVLANSRHMYWYKTSHMSRMMYPELISHSKHSLHVPPSMLKTMRHHCVLEGCRDSQWERHNTLHKAKEVQQIDKFPLIWMILLPRPSWRKAAPHGACSSYCFFHTFFLQLKMNSLKRVHQPLLNVLGQYCKIKQAIFTHLAEASEANKWLREGTVYWGKGTTPGK